MQYLFRGLRRGTGEPVAGRAVAAREDVARIVLNQHGIAVVSICVEAAGPDAPIAPFDTQLDAALKEAGVRVRFDQLPRRHEGQGVWVLDRERVRDRAMRLVREAIGHDAGKRDLQRRIAGMLETLFEARPAEAAPQPPADALAIAAEVDRLAAALAKIEQAMALMSAARSEPRRALPARAPRARSRARDDVLEEIFKTNLELRRAIRGLA